MPAIRMPAIACLLAVCSLAGCAACPVTHVSMDQLVAEYNANAQGIPRLKARAKIQLSFTDHKGRHVQWGSSSPLASPNGLLLLSKGGDAPADPAAPKDFVLVGKEAMGVELFRIGSSASEGKYYFWCNYGDSGKAWWGWHKFAGSPQITEMPIDPNQLLSVLSVCELPEDFTNLPTVLMRMSRDPCAYVLTYVDRQAATGRIVSKRDVYFRWSDAQPRRPFRVDLFDAGGEPVMTAQLAGYAPVATGTPGAAGRPVMPTDISISWPAKRSSAHIVLSEPTTAEAWDTDYCLFLGELPAGIGPEDIIQVDGALDARGGQQ